MPLIRWNDKLSVGVAEIDSQHRRLIDLINELNDAMIQGKGQEALGRILDGLIAYTRSHFAHEERLFAITAYPETTAHKTEHAELIRQVGEFQAGFSQGRVGLTVQIMNLLTAWLSTHIQGSDKKYGPHLNAKGVK